MTTTIREGSTVPDVSFVDPAGAPWRLRDHLGAGPVVLILHRHLA